MTSQNKTKKLLLHDNSDWWLLLFEKVEFLPSLHAIEKHITATTRRHRQNFVTETKIKWIYMVSPSVIHSSQLREKQKKRKNLNGISNCKGELYSQKSVAKHSSSLSNHVSCVMKVLSWFSTRSFLILLLTGANPIKIIFSLKNTIKQ
jgi:hypothetical protein